MRSCDALQGGSSSCLMSVYKFLKMGFSFDKQSVLSLGIKELLHGPLNPKEYIRNKRKNHKTYNSIK